MGCKQQVMTLIMGGVLQHVEIAFDATQKTYPVEAFIYQGDYFEVVLTHQAFKEKQVIPLEGIVQLEKLSDTTYRIDYEDGCLYLYGKK